MPGVFCCIGILSLVYPLANIRYGDGGLPAASSYLIMSFETTNLSTVSMTSLHPKTKDQYSTPLLKAPLSSGARVDFQGPDKKNYAAREPLKRS